MNKANNKRGIGVKVLSILGTIWDFCNLFRHCIDLFLRIFPPKTQSTKHKKIFNFLFCILYYGIILILPLVLAHLCCADHLFWAHYFGGVSLFLMVTLSSFDCMVYLRRWFLLIPFLLLAKKRERAVIFEKRPETGWGRFDYYEPFLQWSPFAHAESPIEGRWLHGETEDRDMKLTTSVQFKDCRGGAWIAKKGLIIDGASIPKLFWNTIGPPYVGTYRNASVVHDAYCEDHPRTGEQAWWAKLHHRDSMVVHRMFYEAMRADHETGNTASGNLFTRWNEWVLDTIIYLTVSIFGPRWRC